MKALSIRQPWAWLIVNGYKGIENRSWRTNFRGSFLIHAPKTFDSEAFGFINSALWEFDTSLDQEDISTKKSDYQLGGFVGMGSIVDCVEVSASPFFTGPYGFELSGVIKTEFLEYPGALKFFDVPEDVVANINPKFETTDIGGLQITKEEKENWYHAMTKHKTRG